MRILMVGPGDMNAMQRPVSWALGHGHHVCLAGFKDPYKNIKKPTNYQFMPLITPEAAAVYKNYKTMPARRSSTITRNR